MKFNLNLAGVEDVIQSVGTTAALNEMADKVVDGVEGQARRFAHTGRFAESIEKTDVKKTAEGKGITVTSTDRDAHIIEWGSVNNPPYAPFRKAASSLGLRLAQGRRP